MLLIVASVVTYAQTDRVTTLQGARTLVVTDSEGQRDNYQVTTEKPFVIHLKEGKLMFGNKTMSLDAINNMRIETPQKFLLNEDSTTFSPYNVEGGLLALRRDFQLNKWNSLVLPVSLTGRHVMDAFGEDALLASFSNIVENENEAQVNYRTINLETDDEVIAPGVHYLIRPTREPDILVGQTSTAYYGATRVSGPAYLLEGAIMTTSNKSPQYKTEQSDLKNVRLRFTGTYTRLEGRNQPLNVYVLNADGEMKLHADSVAAKAFTSWVIPARNTNEIAVNFYVDGIGLTGDPAGLTEVRAESSEVKDRIFDLQGRKISTLKRGLYIINGKKVYVR